ncbi:hypothetical protein WMY93_023867 [Mugilogobius chulae]|uniref:Uncharacterized protein n=1 Tax=Mugilogobius chulae TaxID=88201 RepID=A0AAW0NCF9_9GOBI
MEGVSNGSPGRAQVTHITQAVDQDREDLGERELLHYGICPSARPLRGSGSGTEQQPKDNGAQASVEKERGERKRAPPLRSLFSPASVGMC